MYHFTKIEVQVFSNVLPAGKKTVFLNCKKREKKIVFVQETKILKTICLLGFKKCKYGFNILFQIDSLCQKLCQTPMSAIDHLKKITNTDFYETCNSCQKTFPELVFVGKI